MWRVPPSFASRGFQLKQVLIAAVLVVVGLLGAACSSGLSDEVDSTPQPNTVETVLVTPVPTWTPHIPTATPANVDRQLVSHTPVVPTPTPIPTVVPSPTPIETVLITPVPTWTPHIPTATPANVDRQLVSHTPVVPTPTPIPTVVPSPTPAASVACSPVDLSEIPELVRFYAEGVACIQTDGRQGTAFVVRNTDSGEGYLLTNAHVVGVDPTSVLVQLDNVAYSADVLQISVERDLAMIRICCGNFVVLKRTNRGERTGEWVGALGFVGGKFTYSSGLVRGVIHRSLNTYVEHTAHVQPGGSGGPLLAFPLRAVLRAGEGKGWSLEEGESLGVIGITSAKSSEHEFTTYTIYQSDVSAFVDSVWGALGFELAPRPTTCISCNRDLGISDEYTLDW